MISITDNEKEKWKAYERELQVKVVLSYAYTTSELTLYPKKTLYPNASLFPTRGIGLLPNDDLFPSDTLFPLENTELTQLELTTKSINLLEEIDVKTASIPSNKIEIVVDNEDGKFDEFSENSIINMLNNKTIIDFYVKVSDYNFNLVAHLNYDSVKTNNDKTATLIGYGVFNKLNKIPFRISDDDYVAELDNQGTNTLLSYLNNSYPINFIVPTDSNNTLTSNINLINGKYETLYDVIWQLQTATKNGFWINDRYNNIKLINRRGAICETITQNMQLEKAKLTKEIDLTCVVATNSINSITTSEETGTFKYDYDSIFTNTQGTILNPIMSVLVISNEYDLSDINTSDINVNCTISLIIKSKRYLYILLNGTIGQNVTLSIEKELYKLNIENKDVVIGEEAENYISISNLDNILSTEYYEDIIKTYPINLHIKTKIMGLPYLELGDVVSIETDYGEKIVNITKLDISHDGGYTMNIEGYTTDYDGLFPSDSLYPDDTLYPNMRLEV